MPILKMQTEVVRGVANQLTQKTQLLESELISLNQKTQQLVWAWRGGSSDMFANEIQTTLSRLKELTSAGGDLAVRLEQEVVQWEETAASFGDMTGIISGFVSSSLFGISVGQAVGNIINNLLPDGIPIDNPPKVNLDKDIYENLGGDLYKLNIDDLDKFDPVKAAEGLDTGGRPVLFLVHGINSPDPTGKFEGAYDLIAAQYKHLPETQRPVVVGIEWDSGGVDQRKALDNQLTPGGDDAVSYIKNSYRDANKKASQTSEEFGTFLHEFNKNHPETSVNVITHSLGTKMVMESIQQDGVDANINKFLAVQGAVDVKDINPNGNYSNVVDSHEVSQFGFTSTRDDRALLFHEMTYDDALGRYTGPIIGNVNMYNLEAYDEFKSSNHYGLDHEVIHEHVIPDFFSGENPFGRPKDSL